MRNNREKFRSNRFSSLQNVIGKVLINIFCSQQRFKFKVHVNAR